MRHLISRYRRSINPPWNFKDYFNLVFTFAILLFITFVLLFTSSNLPFGANSNGDFFAQTAIGVGSTNPELELTITPVGNVGIGTSSPTQLPTATPIPSPTLGSRRVFATSTSYNGNLGGINGADSKCQVQANAANLEGTWKAWISDSTISPASRLEHFNGPYLRTDGATIANNWADLTDGSLQNPINRTENASVLPLAVYTWTNTYANGEMMSPVLFNGHYAGSCNDWIFSGDGSTGIVGRGGQANATNSFWSYGVEGQCYNLFRLSCFEQGSTAPSPTDTPIPTSIPTPTGNIGIGSTTPLIPTATPTPFPTATPTPLPTSTPIPSDTTPPSIPTGITANASAYNKVNLSWNASSDNVGVTGYWIVRNGTTIASSTITSFDDNTVNAATTYTYQITAVDIAGNSSLPSASVSVTTPQAPDTQAPTAPTNLTATAVSSSQINLSWNPSSDNIGVTGYEIYRNTVKITTVTGTSFGDVGLSAATTYSYFVKALDTTGNASSNSNVASTTTQAQPTVGNITGTVSNSTGAAIAGAKVVITVNGAKKTFYTNSQGFYTFTNLLPGIYTLNFSAKGYNILKTSVTVTAGITTTNNAILTKQGGR